MTDPFDVETDDFDSGEEAIEYAHEHMRYYPMHELPEDGNVPVDELSEAELREELRMLDAVLGWEKAKRDGDIVARHGDLQTALDYDKAFDAEVKSRIGNKYLDSHGRLVVVVDGHYSYNVTIVTHYHVITVEDNGSISGEGEARETLPEDVETGRWLSVAEFDALLEEGELRPATVVASEESILGLVTDHGLSPAEAVDHYATEVRGEQPAAWARQRGVSDQAVSESRQKAKDKLGE